MGKDDLKFYATGLTAAVLGSVAAMRLGWGDEGVFAAGMIPLWIVMLIFILREPRSNDLKSGRQGTRSVL
jgi:hypothetical protein